jgi:selenocysteine lyase/cysteine desulfurase
LAERGFQLLTPAGTQFASGIVAFAHESPEWLGSQLAAQSVVVWAGDGRVRVSMHPCNDRSDLGKFFTALDTIHQAPRSRDIVDAGYARILSATSPETSVNRKLRPP